MAEINGSLQGRDALQSLFHALDPASVLISENSRSDDQPIIPLSLRPVTDAYFFMERGPRYREYAELREAKLRRKHMRPPEPDIRDTMQTPPRKQVKFQGSSVSGGRKGLSILTQSVPDFSSVIRKENRKPMNALPPLLEMTPPPSKNRPKGTAVGSSARGSKSANAGEKKQGGMMVRKSYACAEELKGLSSAAAASIGRDRIGGRSLRGTRRTVLGSRPI
ncbi:hypothetical protein CRG98_004038 [Punica granatum]|uniref:Uncharacterized protein n=1 Tax=Punica granatum TaxID=22663 RepID=A0A2I0L4L7_PUNGR|nr:hypothetical protein CRG98_004038 [Punica granatum]